MRLPPLSTIDLDAEFPVLGSGLIYLNHAGCSPLPARAAAAVRDYIDRSTAGRVADAEWYHGVLGAKAVLAELLGAKSKHEIAFAPNTVSGLAILAGGLDWKPGDRVVITDVEYPANRYPWTDLKRRGVEVVEARQGSDLRIDVGEVVGLINERTRVVSLSHVQFGSGHRIDLKPVADAVHAVGGLLCVDAIQSLGAMAVPVRDLGVDFLAAGSQKWMLGAEGASFVWCDQALCGRLTPPVPGWLGRVNALDYTHYDERWLPDARRFETGTMSVLALRAMRASAELLLEVGLDNVWARLDAVCEHLRSGLSEKGYRVVSPPGPDERSGIVAFDAADVSTHAQTVRSMGERGITIVERVGHLRISPHFYNSLDQMDAVVAALP